MHARGGRLGVGLGEGCMLGLGSGARWCAAVPLTWPGHRPLAPQVVPPVSKRLACGDVGTGGMAAPEDIAAACRAALAAAGLLAAE